jgi:hypothetical protein
MASILFNLITAIASLTAQAQPADIVQTARVAVERLEKADYDGVVVMFSARLREKLPAKKMQQTWEGVHRKSGRLLRTGEPMTATKDNLRRVTIPGQFEKHRVDVEVVFNDSSQIAGILLHRK